MFEDEEFRLFQEAQAALHKGETESAEGDDPEGVSPVLSGETALPEPSREILEGEYVEPEEEIDPYIRNVKQLHSQGDSEATVRYMRSPQSEQDFREHMEIVGDRSMMEALNHNARERGEPPPFDQDKMKSILKRDHEGREQTQATREEDGYVERDRKRLGELRQSLGLPPSPCETHLLGPAESKQ
jgi:hypothetical protein